MNPAVSFLRAGPEAHSPRGLRLLRAAILLTFVASSACRPLRPLAIPPAPSPVPVAVGPAPSEAPLRDQVVETAVSVFGDSAAIAASDSLSAEPVWDLDVRPYETHERVAFYINRFSTSARETFVAQLSRGTRYEPMIRAKMRANGMPEDLTYLALIESGYDPHAYSRAAAVGMWQFMSSTARGVGLRVDWWMDERRDPARATDAAIRFLGSLQRQFGSLYLAAAAYNGGPGRVSRGLSMFADEMEGAEGEDRFFALAEQSYLRAETKNYVPQLIAAALVAKQPAQFGLRVDTLPAYAYDSVQVDPGTSLAVLATVSGATPEELRDLNPALLRGITPPDASVWIRLPVGRADSTKVALDRLAPADRRGYSNTKVVGTSSTPAAFAKRHGVSLTALRAINPTMRTTKKGRLVSGQTLRIPARDAAKFALTVPNPSIEKYGSAQSTRSSTASATSSVHVVRRGETLGGIARRYSLSESQLRALNGIRGSRILAGQKLKVRGTTRTTAAPSEVSTPRKTPAKKVGTSKSKKKTTAK